MSSPYVSSMAGSPVVASNASLPSSSAHQTGNGRRQRRAAPPPCLFKNADGSEWAPSAAAAARTERSGVAAALALAADGDGAALVSRTAGGARRSGRSSNQPTPPPAAAESGDVGGELLSPPSSLTTTTSRRKKGTTPVTSTKHAGPRRPHLASVPPTATAASSPLASPSVSTSFSVSANGSPTMQGVGRLVRVESTSLARSSAPPSTLDASRSRSSKVWVTTMAASVSTVRGDGLSVSNPANANASPTIGDGGEAAAVRYPSIVGRGGGGRGGGAVIANVPSSDPAADAAKNNASSYASPLSFSDIANSAAECPTASAHTRVASEDGGATEGNPFADQKVDVDEGPDDDEEDGSGDVTERPPTDTQLFAIPAAAVAYFAEAAAGDFDLLDFGRRVGAAYAVGATDSDAEGESGGAGGCDVRGLASAVAAAAAAERRAFSVVSTAGRGSSNSSLTSFGLFDVDDDDSGAPEAAVNVDGGQNSGETLEHSAPVAGQHDAADTTAVSAYAGQATPAALLTTPSRGPTPFAFVAAGAPDAAAAPLSLASNASPAKGLGGQLPEEGSAAAAPTLSAEALRRLDAVAAAESLRSPSAVEHLNNNPNCPTPTAASIASSTWGGGGRRQHQSRLNNTNNTAISNGAASPSGGGANAALSASASDLEALAINNSSPHMLVLPRNALDYHVMRAIGGRVSGGLGGPKGLFMVSSVLGGKRIADCATAGAGSDAPMGALLSGNGGSPFMFGRAGSVGGGVPHLSQAASHFFNTHRFVGGAAGGGASLSGLQVASVLAAIALQRRMAAASAVANTNTNGAEKSNSNGVAGDGSGAADGKSLGGSTSDVDAHHMAILEELRRRAGSDPQPPLMSLSLARRGGGGQQQQRQHSDGGSDLRQSPSAASGGFGGQWVLAAAPTLDSDSWCSTPFRGNGNGNGGGGGGLSFHQQQQQQQQQDAFNSALAEAFEVISSSQPPPSKRSGRRMIDAATPASGEGGVETPLTVFSSPNNSKKRRGAPDTHQSHGLFPPLAPLLVGAVDPTAAVPSRPHALMQPQRMMRASPSEAAFSVASEGTAATGTSFDIVSVAGTARSGPLPGVGGLSLAQSQHSASGRAGAAAVLAATPKSASSSSVVLVDAAFGTAQRRQPNSGSANLLPTANAHVTTVVAPPPALEQSAVAAATMAYFPSAQQHHSPLNPQSHGGRSLPRVGSTDSWATVSSALVGAGARTAAVGAVAGPSAVRLQPLPQAASANSTKPEKAGAPPRHKSGGAAAPPSPPLRNPYTNVKIKSAPSPLTTGVYAGVVVPAPSHHSHSAGAAAMTARGGGGGARGGSRSLAPACRPLFRIPDSRGFANLTDCSASSDDEDN